MRFSRELSGITLVLAMSMGCGTEEKGGVTNGLPNPPPPGQIKEAALCQFNMDCDEGHCDLGECVAECDPETSSKGDAPRKSCQEGYTCSPRGTCVEGKKGSKGTDERIANADRERPVQILPAGRVYLESTALPLTERSSSVKLRLHSTSDKPVRYRIENNSSYLRIDNPRGAFTKATDLVFTVDASKFKDQDIAGSVRVITELGDVVATVPLHVGITGRYKGTLNFDEGSVPMGQAQMAFDLIEHNGKIEAQIRSNESLLFPDLDGGPTGVGSYSTTDGLSVTFRQRIELGEGGSRNTFDRVIGRSITLRATPGDNGSLDGTFEETIHNLFDGAVVVRGHVHFEYEPYVTLPKIKVQDAPEMPRSGPSKALPSVGQVFGLGDRSCAEYLTCSGPSCIPTIEAAFYAPLVNAMPMNAKPKSTEPFTELAGNCRDSFGKATIEDWRKDTASANKCAYMPPLACALGYAATLPFSDEKNGHNFGRLYAELVAPVMLTAKDDVVTGLMKGIVSSNDEEILSYKRAMETTMPVRKWVLQPAFLDYMLRMSPSGAKGKGPSAKDDYRTEKQFYPSLRAMAELFSTTAVIDAELARARGANNDDRSTILRDTQMKAVFGYLESLSLIKITDQWRPTSLPPTIAASFTGVLSKLDSAFSAAIDGKNFLGVTDGFVPFVYRAEDIGKGATNFEQMVALTEPELAIELDMETNYLSSKRQYETNQELLQGSLSAIRNDFDRRLHEICGGAFDIEGFNPAVSKLETLCGASFGGEAGLAQAQINEAQTLLNISQARIKGMKDKIDIAKRTLAKTQQVHVENLTFISSEGKALKDLNMVETTLSIQEKALDLAAHTSLLNFGAPLALAAGGAVIKAIQGKVQEQKIQYETSQKMHFEQAGAKIELITGMAGIQSQIVDLTQLGVEMQADIERLVLSNIRLANLIVSASDTLKERAQMLTLLKKNPASDPSVRILRDQAALSLIQTRAEAQKSLYLSGRALEYELNMSIATLPGAILSASSGSKLKARISCMRSIHNRARIAHGTPQEYTTTFSVRERLGITGPRKDALTGVEMSAGEQFRRVMLKNDNLDGHGGVGFFFTTNLQKDNGLWSSNVCEDRLKTVQAQLVGDGLGDNQAELDLSLAGAGLMRQCDSGEHFSAWSLGAQDKATAALAILQAGVNSFGDAPANASLFGQPVARASWKLIIPSALTAPSNADVDISKIDDVIIKVTHLALPKQAASQSIELSCLSEK